MFRLPKKLRQKLLLKSFSRKKILTFTWNPLCFLFPMCLGARVGPSYRHISPGHRWQRRLSGSELRRCQSPGFKGWKGLGGVDGPHVGEAPVEVRTAKYVFFSYKLFTPLKINGWNRKNEGLVQMIILFKQVPCLFSRV